MTKKRKTSDRSTRRTTSGFFNSDSPQEKPKRAAVTNIGPKPLRIIGGDLRRRTIVYNGDLQTRPMKDSVRENLFNILGTAIKGTVAWDLFAGTGIIAIESISRGATNAVAIDLSRDCIRSIRNATRNLNIDDRVECLLGDTFRIAPTRFQYATDEKRTVFCCPPYKLWDSKLELLNELLKASVATAAPGSLIVAESTNKFKAESLLDLDWDIRTYGNTRLFVAEI